MWNSLSSYVVKSDTVNTLYNQLVKHWNDQEIFFDCNAVTGNGSLPIECERVAV